MSAQVAADLRAAANVLERDGWTQGSWMSDGCRRCAAGALVAAVDPGARDPHSFWGTEAFDRWDIAVVAMMKVIGGGSVSLWNDAPGRTADEVIAALRAAADRAEATDD